MPLAPVTAPAEEPLTLTEAKAHLRVTAADDDTYITTLIIVARQWAENVTRRALITQTWDLFLDKFPSMLSPGSMIEVPLPPLVSVTTVKYTDTDGVQQTLSASLYDVDINAERGRITPAYGEVWPSTRAEMNAVEIRIVAGYGATAFVPVKIKQAMLLLIGHLYERREDTVVGVTPARVPQASEWLIADYQSIRF